MQVDAAIETAGKAVEVAERASDLGMISLVILEAVFLLWISYTARKWMDNHAERTWERLEARDQSWQDAFKEDRVELVAFFKAITAEHNKGIERLTMAIDRWSPNNRRGEV